MHFASNTNLLKNLVMKQIAIALLLMFFCSTASAQILTIPQEIDEYPGAWIDSLTDNIEVVYDTTRYEEVSSETLILVSWILFDHKQDILLDRKTDTTKIEFVEKTKLRLTLGGSHSNITQPRNWGLDFGVQYFPFETESYYLFGEIINLDPESGDAAYNIGLLVDVAEVLRVFSWQLSKDKWNGSGLKGIFTLGFSWTYAPSRPFEQASHRIATQIGGRWVAPSQNWGIYGLFDGGVGTWGVDQFGTADLLIQWRFGIFYNIKKRTVAQGYPVRIKKK